MSQNDYQAQPLRGRTRRRGCGCSHLVHEHGCRNRYDKGCHCDICRTANTAKRRATRGMDPVQAEQQRYLQDEIAWFITWNMTDERIADRVGVPVYTVERVRIKVGKL